MKAYRSRYAELEALGARIIAVSSDDRETQERRPKPTAYWLGNVARNDALPIDMTTCSVT